MCRMRKDKKRLAPDAWLRSAADIDWTAIQACGYRLLLSDVDNTLQPHGLRHAEPEAVEILRAAETAGLRVALISNSKTERAASMGRSFEQALGHPLAVYGMAKKPSPNRLLEACRDAGIGPQHALMLGDQYFTDCIAGLRAVGASVLVEPVTRDEPWYIRLKRIGERIVFFSLKIHMPYNRIRKIDGP